MRNEHALALVAAIGCVVAGYSLSFVTTAKLTEFLEEGGVAAGRYKSPQS